MINQEVAAAAPIQESPPSMPVQEKQISKQDSNMTNGESSMRNRARPPKLQTVAQGIDVNLTGQTPERAMLPTLPKL